MKVVENSSSSLALEQPSRNLADNIIVENALSPIIIMRWNSLTNLIREKMIIAYKEIEPVIAEKYIFDFYGLLKNEFNMQDVYIYPHIIGNGYFSSTEYNGNLLRIALLDEERLSIYVELFYKL